MSYGVNDQIIAKVAERYYPVGHYMITRKNISPNDLGVKGTWTLTHKKLDPDVIKDMKFFTFPSTTTEVAQVNHCDGYTITTTLCLRTTQTFSDTNINIATLNIDALSTTQVALNMYTVGWLHGAPSAAVMITAGAISSSTRSVNIGVPEVWHSAGTRSFTAASNNIWFTARIFCYGDSTEFKDEVCNEFYWLRTA